MGEGGEGGAGLQLISSCFEPASPEFACPEPVEGVEGELSQRVADFYLCDTIGIHRQTVFFLAFRVECEFDFNLFVILTRCATSQDHFFYLIVKTILWKQKSGLLI